jgi:hypothetical protein
MVEMLTMEQTAPTSGLLLGVRGVAGSQGKTGLSTAAAFGWWWDDGSPWDDWGGWDADGWDGDGWDGWDGDF